MRKRSWILATVLLAALLPVMATAQDLGNVGLRTVSATLANNVACTGAAQNFVTNSGITGFRNLGQTSHLATATSNASAFQMEIDGIDNLGNVYRLSDLQLGIPTSAKGGLVVTASGYMTNIQVSVTCTVGATFSAAYTGSFSPQPPNIAGTLLASTDKLPFQSAAANANSSITFQTPYANSQGTIVFQYAAAGPGGSTITAQCLSNANVNLSAFTFSPTTANTAQLFTVPASTCPFVTLTYTSGGASATTYSLEYTFTTVGTASTTGSTTGQVQPSVTKNTETTSGANAAQTVSIAAITGQRVYLYSVGTRSSAGTCSLTVKDGVGGTVIWSSDSGFVNTSTRTATWTTPLASSVGNGMDIVVSACGVANTSTLDVQASQQ